MERQTDAEKVQSKADELHQSLSDRIRTSERWTLFFRVGLVILGGGLAVVGGFIPAPAENEFPLKPILGIGGALMAITGGILLALIEQKSAEDLTQARESLELAKSFLSNREQVQNQFKEMRRLDRKRRSLITALNTMREAAEQAAYKNETDAKTTINTALDVSINQLLSAMGYDAGEYYSVSIFKVEQDDDASELSLLVDKRANRNEERESSRTWKKGEGFTGAAWQRNSEVIVRDTSSSESKSAFYIPDKKQRSNDDDRYRSIASFPIRVGDPPEIWGVVTITSDHVGRFSEDSNDGTTENVDAARSIAGMVALLAGFTYMNHCEDEKNEKAD